MGRFAVIKKLSGRVVILLFGIIIINVLLYFDYELDLKDYYRMLTDEVQSSAKMVSTTISSSFLVEHLDIINNGSKCKKESYDRIKSLLKNCRDSFGYKFTYTFYVEDEDVIYLVDAEEDSDPTFVPIGYRDDALTSLVNSIRKNPNKPGSDFTYIRKWRTSLTGYCPISDKGMAENKGYVGVDVSSEEMKHLTMAVTLSYTRSASAVNIIMLLMFVIFFLVELEIYSRHEECRLDISNSLVTPGRVKDRIKERNKEDSMAIRMSNVEDEFEQKKGGD